MEDEILEYKKRLREQYKKMNYEEKKKYWFRHIWYTERESEFGYLSFFSEDRIINLEREDPQIRKILKETIIEFYEAIDEELPIEKLKNIL